MAIMLQHKRAPVHFDPQPAESYPVSIFDSTVEDERRLAGIELLTLLIEEFGAATVSSWCRNITALKEPLPDPPNLMAQLLASLEAQKHEEKEFARGGSVPGTPHGDLPRRTEGDT